MAFPWQLWTVIADFAPAAQVRHRMRLPPQPSPLPVTFVPVELVERSPLHRRTADSAASLHIELVGGRRICVVALMDALFAIDREAREQKLSLDDRHALRQERAPAILAELHALLLAMQASGTILPKSIEGNAISYTLACWQK